MFARNNDPHIILSKQILITKYSNHQVIYNYLNNQMSIAKEDFDICF
jgi:hypothetical protein